MNKQQFLNVLSESLQALSPAERADILRDFEEYFNAGRAEGKTEADIVAGLGSPDEIAAELRATYALDSSGQLPRTTGDVMRSVLSALLMGAFNLIIVLGPLLGLAGIVFAAWVVGITFSATPLLVLLGEALYAGPFNLFEFFNSLVLAGLGIFIILGMIYLTRLLLRWLGIYVRFNIDFIKGGGRRG